MGASPWGVNSMGMPPQYYAAYQSAYPYYATGYPMYNMMNSYPPTAQGYASYPTTAVNQNFTSPNQAETVLASSNQNTENNSTASNVRQRTAVSQSTVGQNSPQAAPVAGSPSQNNPIVVDNGPRITQSGMFSLIVLWVIAVSIIALICRRLFVVS